MKASSRLAVHRGRIVDEVRGDEPLVELHAVDVLDLGLGGLSLLDRDHAVLADAFEGLGQQLADRLVVVGTDRADVGDFRLLGDRLGHLDQLGLGRVHRLLNAAPHRRRIGPGHDVAQTFLENRPRQDRGRRGAVAGQVGGLLGHLDDQLGAHVLETVLQFDLLGHRHAVLGHRRSAIGLVDDHVASRGAHRNGHGVRQFVHALHHLLPGMVFKKQLFRHA